MGQFGPGEVIPPVIVGEGHEASDDQTLIDQVQRHLDVETPSSAIEQLDVNQNVWKLLGFEMPPLSGEQVDHLSEAALANPDLRLFAAPILDAGDRQILAEISRRLPQVHIGYGSSALVGARLGEPYGDLLLNPDRPLRGDTTELTLVHKTATGLFASQQEYIDSLAQSGQAIMSPNGRLWVLPLIEPPLKDRPDYTGKDPGQLYKEDIDPVLTPEALLFRILMSRIGNTDNSPYVIDFANEAVAVLDTRTRAKEITSVAGVAWLNSLQVYNIEATPAREHQPYGHYVPKTVSGLSAAHA